jgi:hypothetical protein
MSNFIKHLKTIRKHKKYVRQACFKMGLFWQGLFHDLSKYSLTELSICKYYSGTRSPHQNARDSIGYSPSWIHHYHNNKHHFQYWWDEDEDGNIIPMKMPYKYVIESFCDMLGASKAYTVKDWGPDLLLCYWDQKCAGKRIMHEKSATLTEYLIKQMADLGEDDFLVWFKENNDFLKYYYGY